MAWRFDAGTDRLIVPGWTGGVGTILFWCRRVADRNAYSNPVVGWSNADATGTIRFGIGSDSGGDALVLFDSAFNALSGGPSVAGGDWVAVAAVMSGTGWTFYWGTDPASLTSSSGTRVATGTVGSFTLSDPADWWSGDLAGLKVFTRALSGAEITAELQTYAQVSGTNLVYRASLQTSSTTPETGAAMTAGSTAITVVDGPPALGGATGVLAAAIPRPVAALTGTVTVAGQVGVTLQRPVANIAATVTDQGQLVASLPRPVAALAGTVTVAGQLAAILPPPIANIAGTHPVVGQLAVVLPLPVADLHSAGPVLVLPLHAGEPELEAAWAAGEPVVDALWHAGEPELIG